MDYIFDNKTIPDLSYAEIARLSPMQADTAQNGFFDIHPQHIEVNSGAFTHPSAVRFPIVTVAQTHSGIIVSCPCDAGDHQLCEHQAQVLYNIVDRSYLRIYFDKALRRMKMQQVAKAFGMETMEHLDDYFQVIYTNKSVEIQPKNKALFAFNAETDAYMKEHLLPQKKVQTGAAPADSPDATTVMVFRKHKFHDQLIVELYRGQMTKDGKVKNPLSPVDPLAQIWDTQQLPEAKFYTAVARFQQPLTTAKSAADIAALKIIVKNPFGYQVFYHDPKVSENISATALVAVELAQVKADVQLSVEEKKPFYEVSGTLELKGVHYDLQDLKIRYGYFMLLDGTLYLLPNTDLLRVVDFFKKNNHQLLIHQSKFDDFRRSILTQLENRIVIKYNYVQPATPQQIQSGGFDQSTDRLIYLSDEENYVAITPVVRYGQVEIPVFSRKQIYDADKKGNTFLVKRDNALEVAFTAIIAGTHPEFEEQIQESEYFYLHKEKFLDETWFLNAFETWRAHDIQILGFREIKNNRYNANKGTVSVRINSGIDWFNAAFSVRFGQQKASLKHLQQSLRNKSKFVQLDDGSLGILPEEWIARLAEYFNLGEIVSDELLIAKNNFAVLSSLTAVEFSDEVIDELAVYNARLANFDQIKDVPVPEGLQAQLRDYQKQGLNWLNCLDDFNFGACLADDMGLGKTLQIIAFILTQRTKQARNANLVIVPTSLLFNWQAEVAKFAPSLRIFTHYGNSRIKDPSEFDGYEILLTTYGMLLSDLNLFKKYRFNYIILDESQAIKNPDSQRYKAARMLQSRNKIVMTGTPVENNTFDIYGQLSFACPGLLGNKVYFKDTYAIPIDRFEDHSRAKTLQQKIKPFILRRTKTQVAQELPEKTEMVLYCEMGPEQRAIYNTREKELRDFVSSLTNDEIPKNSMHVLTGLTQLRQICNAPALVKDATVNGHSAKIDVLIEQIENKSHQHKILVFSQFVSMLDLIKHELETRNIPFEYLTGQTKDRAARVNSFQETDQVRVFLISLKAGGTGLNLTEADYVYLVDPWWNPAVENQAIDRSYRIGQQKNVIAVRLICPDTIEEKILKLQESKTQLANNLIKTDASIFKSLTQQDLLAMLGK